MYTHTYIYVHIYIYTHTHIHTHTILVVSILILLSEKEKYMYYRLNCFSPQIHVLKLKPNVIVFGGSAFNEVIRLKKSHRIVA